MTLPGLITKHGLRIAVEGCGHGVLHEIYASVAKACELKGWPGVDLLIIGGDFQVRTTIAMLGRAVANRTGCPQCIRLESRVNAPQILRNARLP